MRERRGVFEPVSGGLGRPARRAARRWPLGASFIERHITLDRAMWGTDQAASVEIGGLERLVHIRDIETSLGDRVERIYDSELPARRKLRGGCSKT